MSRQEPVGVAVVGAGRWGPNLMRNLVQIPQARLLMIAEPDPAAADACARRFPRARVVSALDDVLSNDAVEAVVLATPTITHAPLLRRCLLADRHVMVEKPLADNLPAAREVAALAADRGRVAMVGHTFLYNASIRFVAEYLAAGGVGDVQYLTLTRTNLGPIRVDVNAAWDLCSHDIAIANFLMGTGAQSVSAIGASWLNPAVEDVCFASLQFPDGVLAHVHGSWLSPKKVRETVVVGSKGMVIVDDLDPVQPVSIFDSTVADREASPAWLASQGQVRIRVNPGSALSPVLDLIEPLAVQCQHFIDAIVSGTPVTTDFGFGLSVVAALDGIDRSMQAGGASAAIGDHAP